MKIGRSALFHQKVSKKFTNCFFHDPLLGPPWGPKIDQKFSFFAKWRSREIFSARFLWLAVFSHFWRRCGSIFGGPDPQKVMTLTGISHFFDFQKNRKKRPPGTPKWTPDGQELAKKVAKTTKIAKKSSFLRDQFLTIFLNAFLSGFFGTPGTLGGMREASLGRDLEGKPPLVRRGW